MEQGPDFWCWFDTTQFSYHCIHPIHAKMFSIQMLLHFSQIVQRVCTLVLFISLALKRSAIITIYIYIYRCNRVYYVCTVLSVRMHVHLLLRWRQARELNVDTFRPGGNWSIHGLPWIKIAMVCAVVTVSKHDAFTVGCTKFKKDVLRNHATTLDHRAALGARSVRKDMQHAVANTHRSQEATIIAALKTVYFMAKKNLVNDIFGYM